MTSTSARSAARSAARHRAQPALRLGAVVAATGLIAFTTPALADAHVHVEPDSTAAGSSSALTFRVPNEAETADTVKVSVQLPQDTPFLEVSTKAVPGWTVTSSEQQLPKPATYEGTTLTKAVRTVTWTAGKDAGLPPGQYQEFDVSVAPLPAAGTTVVLPATQTYSDGTVVHWDQPTPASGEEPEHPAPQLVVTAAVPEGDAPASPNPASPSTSGSGTSGSASVTSTKPSDSDGVARGLGGAALVVAAAGLAVALLRGRRRTT